MKDTRKFTVWLTDATSLVDATEDRSPTYYIDDGDNNSMEKHGWIKVASFEHSFERPSLKKIMPQAVAAIRKEIQSNNLKAATENAKLEIMISKLLSLEFDGGSQ